MPALAGCGGSSGAAATAATRAAGDISSHRATPAPTPTPSPVAQTEAKPKPCTLHVAPGFSCTMQERIEHVEAYLDGAPGMIGVVLRDRSTGASWTNSRANTLFPAASTMKLAVATDLLRRNRSGQIHFSSSDWNLMYNMLHESDDNAANALWSKYEGASFLTRIRAFGMADAEFTGEINWGFMYVTPEDLDHLVDYDLNDLPSSLRGYLVGMLQHVAPIQQWGVWGAGPDNHPGNKDGWEDDENETLWITNTVGFEGPDQRYTLAVMYNLEGYGKAGTSRGFQYGSNKLTQIAAILFQGHYTAQPTASATP